MTRFHGRERALASSDAIRAVGMLDWTTVARGGRRPAVLACVPVARGNPYQALLYAGLPDVGIRPVNGFDVDTVLGLARALRGGPELVVHLHWLNVVTAKNRNDQEAGAAAERFLDYLREIRCAGGRLLWTVHNAVPHDSKFPAIDCTMRAAVAEICERIHVMSPRTRAHVAPFFDLPADKIFTVPHPSYDGVYPNFLPRSLARQELGLPDGVAAHLMVGAVKPYKGLDDLAFGFDVVSKREPGGHVLIVAGQPDHSDEAAKFVEWASAHPAVLAFFGKVAVEDMQGFLKAADLAVYPYRRSLNSGALALTNTFGIPAVLASTSGEAAGAAPSYAEVYDSTAPGALADAMIAASRRLLTAEARAAARAAAERNAAPRVASAFAQEVRSWLDVPHGAAAERALDPSAVTTVAPQH